MSCQGLSVPKSDIEHFFLPKMAQTAAGLTETETITVNRFAIVEFTKRGRRSNMIMVIVPTGWLVFNSRNKIMQVKCVEGLFDKEERMILKETIKNEENPPDGWQLRNVKIISQARKFLKIMIITIPKILNFTPVAVSLI